MIAAGSNAWLRERIAALATEYRLTPAEVDVLETVVRSRPLDELMARRRIVANTVKSFVRALREKLGVSSVEEIRRLALDEELPLRRPGRREASGVCDGTAVGNSQ